MTQRLEHHPRGYYSITEVLKTIAGIVSALAVTTLIVNACNEMDKSLAAQIVPRPVLMTDAVSAAELLGGKELQAFSPAMAEVLQSGIVVKVADPFDGKEKILEVTSVMTDERGGVIGVFAKSTATNILEEVQGYMVSEITAVVLKD